MKFDIGLLHEKIISNQFEEAFDYLAKAIKSINHFNKISKILIVRRSEFNDLTYQQRLGKLETGTFLIKTNEIRHILLDLATEVDLYYDNKEYLNNRDALLDRELTIIESRLSETKLANNVILIGKTGTGKTTLLSSISNYINKNFVLNYESKPSQLLGYRKFVKRELNKGNKWSENLTKPLQESPIEYNLSFEDIASNENIPINFLELSSELLLSFENHSKKISTEMFKKHFQGVQYFLFLIPYSKSIQDDYLFRLISIVREISDNKINASIIVTKWDNRESSELLSDFVYHNLKKSLELIFEDGIRIFPFSLASKQYESTDKIINWMLHEIKTAPNNVLAPIASIRRLLRQH